MSTSIEPCVLGRFVVVVASTTSAVPVMSPKFQPRPSRMSATVSQPVDPAGASEASSPATVRQRLDAAAIGRRPIRSTSGPVTSDGRNIAAMCRLITSPTAPRPW